ncbi:hypothetical protein CCH79_00006473, partial [Gambusia affinis]
MFFERNDTTNEKVIHEKLKGEEDKGVKTPPTPAQCFYLRPTCISSIAFCFGFASGTNRRENESTEADYESVPVEAYGLAMLKGMGWKKGEGIGRTFKQDVKPIEHQLRPKGLGLGADRSAIKDLEPGKRQRPPKPGEEQSKQEELAMAPGGCVLVGSGAHKDLYGKVKLAPRMHRSRSFPLQTKMASHGEDTIASKAVISDEQTERKTAAVSFGFTKTAHKFKPTAKIEKDYLTGIDRNELQSSKPTEKPKELIIPLIQKNRWSQAGQRGDGNGKPEAAEQDGDSVESQAVKELIEDSRRQLELWENGPQTEGSLNLSIPLLMQNKMPEGFEDGDRVKVDLRPESTGVSVLPRDMRAANHIALFVFIRGQDARVTAVRARFDVASCVRVDCLPASLAGEPPEEMRVSECDGPGPNG